MADKKQIQGHYDNWSTDIWFKIITPSQGTFPDYSGACFWGDFSLPLKQAQKQKHAFILSQLGLKEGEGIIDIGSGYGAMLNAAKERGISSFGITLSPGQALYCQENHLDAICMDWKDIYKGSLGKFDGVVSLGAFEHFCSVEEYLAGKQKEIYRQFFEFVSDLLGPGSMFYLQTMTWNGHAPDVNAIYAGEKTGEEAEILLRIEKLFPGSMLPVGIDQITECASECFEMVYQESGRLDYIETLKRWREPTAELWKIKNIPFLMRFAWSYLKNCDTRMQIAALTKGDLAKCFESGIMEHRRIFFRKK